MKNYAAQIAPQIRKDPNIKSLKITTLQFMELFENELKRTYWAEKALVRTIPELIKNLSSQDLKEVVKNHLNETREHLSRLEKVFLLSNIRLEAKKSHPMERHLHIALFINDSYEAGIVFDLEIVLALRKVELCEIESYEILCQLAEKIGLGASVDILQKTLYEELTAHEILTELKVVLTTISQTTFEAYGEKDDYEEIQADNLQYA